ncbi:hypothetical protein BDV93DRAFT_468765 [Ceratobasidium sp. AG-I]|nr:hypothetical protein BDV93DRAFT_468765 [Ceratobasidium sp. AG-I]
MQAVPVSPTTPPTPSFAPNDVVGTVDYSKPIALLLKTSTLRAHELVEQSSGAVKLLRGELSREEYIYFTMVLWKVYSVLEAGLDKFSSNPVLAPTYRPALLHRATRLSSDIAYLTNTSEQTWQSTPLYLSLISTPPPGLRAYTAHLESLISSPSEADHAKLLSHAYVRYMGDLSGGQSIRARMVKAYGLPTQGAGASFFDFGSVDGSVGLDADGGERRATMGELGKVKDWYRQGMNEGVGDDEEMKAILIQEANIAFDLNGQLFQDVDITVSDSDFPLDKSGKVVFDASQQEQEKTYPVSSVVAVVMALALAHFMLVVGGFTGSKGTDKLEGVMLWLRSVLGN